MNKLTTYIIANLISIILLTLIPYLFVSYVNWSWQDLSEWSDTGRLGFAMAQTGIYGFGLVGTNFLISDYFNK